MYVVEAPPRPKVFKLPPAAKPAPRARSIASRFLDRRPLLLGMLLLAIGASLLATKKPLFTVTHEPNHSASITVETPKTTAAAIEQAATVQTASVQPANQGHSVALHDESGSIVGQLAK